MSREKKRAEQLEQKFQRLLGELKDQDAELATLYEEHDIDRDKVAEVKQSIDQFLSEAPPNRAPAKPKQVAVDHRFVLRA